MWTNSNMISQLNQWKLCGDTHSECLTPVAAGNTNPVTLISSRLFVLGSGAFTRTVNVTVSVSDIFDLFDVMCKQQHRITLNQFLNGTKIVT